MSYDPRDQAHLLGDQYRTASNLEARIQIYRFGEQRQDFRRWMFDHYHLPPNARVLEVGSGNGALWQQNTDRIPPGWDITLSDLSPGMLADAEANLQDAGRPFDFRVMDVQSIPDPDSTFDAVIANHMLYHVPDLEQGLREIRRVLKHGGKLYASTLGRDHFRELGVLVSGFQTPTAADRDLPFLLESGEAILRPWFDHATVYRTSDVLSIPLVEPILIYLASGHHREVVNGPHRSEIITRIEREIAEHGVFCVTTDAGMFTAW